MNIVANPEYSVGIFNKLNMTKSNAMLTSTVTEIASFNACDTLVSRGQDVKLWYYIINGYVAESLKTHKEEIKIIKLYGPGSWFGEDSIFNAKNASFDYIALKNTDCLKVPSHHVMELAKTDTGFLYEILKKLSIRSQYTTEMLMLHRSGSPCARTILGIAKLIETLPQFDFRYNDSNFSNEVSIPISQNDLANLCCVSRTIFNQTMRKLSECGLVSTSYRTLTFHKLRIWSSFAKKICSEIDISLNDPINDWLISFEIYGNDLARNNTLYCASL